MENGGQMVKRKSIVKPGDPNSEMSRFVAQAISDYLTRSRRDNRMVISVNDEELAMITEVAKHQNMPKATVLRACAMLGVAQFLEAVAKPKK